MKQDIDTKITSDEIVVDGRDVERAELLALKRRSQSADTEHTIVVDDELLTTEAK